MNRKKGGFPEISNPNRGTKAPTGKKGPELGLAKQQQHHNRPEYAQQTQLQSGFIMQGIDRKEAKRMAKAKIKEGQ
ncbi:hypothetical protein QWZ03_19830 [Chitinimonas viridis]|uniref:Uncharacterized protein n=1 Tax=Chitinimonas viridis TaxID=664880 RepID=A0ABT8B9V8_9NEIS|nr:hypothetical protein [Chitinimonas viridis]MDN3579022.1 hypothetical protein [Chitinimonas viridis]